MPSLRSLFQSTIMSSLLRPNIFLSTILSDLSTYVPPSMLRTTFHIHSDIKLLLMFLMLSCFPSVGYLFTQDTSEFEHRVCGCL